MRNIISTQSLTNILLVGILMVQIFSYFNTKEQLRNLYIELGDVSEDVSGMSIDIEDIRYK
jgi:hypothetical protein